jgi:ABC-type nitrate/sulfonate/bicarbonate transport system substrate-binding protein
MFHSRSSFDASFAAFGVACALAIGGCGNSAATGNTATSDAGNTGTTAATSSEPITIGYSDWPGWVAWDIADQQGFFKKHGANVKLVWFPVYTDSLNALTAGQVDANSQTWGDTMGPLAQLIRHSRL